MVDSIAWLAFLESCRAWSVRGVVGLLLGAAVPGCDAAVDIACSSEWAQRRGLSCVWLRRR